MRREGREPLPDHAGESPLLSRSGGEKGLRGSGAGTLGVPLEGTRRVGGLLGKAETPVLWPPHAKSCLIGKDSDAGRDCGQEEKGTTEDETAGWRH